jgi:hypothetical protein
MCDFNGEKVREFVVHGITGKLIFLTSIHISDEHITVF